MVQAKRNSTALKFSVGEAIQIKKAHFKVLRLVGDEVYLEQEETSHIKQFNMHDIIDLYFDGQIRLGEWRQVAGNDNWQRPFSSFTERDQKAALRTEAYLKAVHEAMPDKLNDRKIDVIVKSVNPADKGMSSRQIRRWLVRWLNAGKDIKAVVPGNRFKGNRTERHPSLLNDFIKEAIDEVYLDRTKGTVEAAYLYVRKWIKAYNKPLSDSERMPFPSKSTLYKKIKKIDPYEKALKREGPEIADKIFEPIFSMKRATRPMQIVQVDHTKVDIMVTVKGENTVQRVWLTLAIDQYSRMVVGFHLSLKDPSYNSLASCLKHMIRPKTNYRQEWPCFGCAEEILVDNGADFHSTAFQDLCATLGSNLRYCEAARGRQKPHVERFFKSLNHRLFHLLPGTTFESPLKRGDYNSVEQAVIDFDAMVQILEEHIATDYNKKWHRGINDSPLNKWNKGVELYPVHVPSSVADLDLIFAHSRQQVVSRKGVEINCTHYNSNKLNDLYARHVGEKGKKFVIKYNPEDMTKVWVQDPASGLYIEAYCLDHDSIDGITYDDQKRAMAQVQLQRKKVEGQYFDELPTENLSDKFKVGRLREKSTRKPRRLPNDKAVLGPRNTPDNFDGFLGIDGPVEDVFEDPADPYDDGSRVITEDDGFEDFYLNQPDLDD
ncbi:Mu transposase C-terminal domain-containing protein [Kiloniella sp.]|uniref:Mu transposase C-terminal domain-containing protein n=1 Tax=Kiloniella sp. TaxID=1938587 RepID=UPI003A8CB886